MHRLELVTTRLIEADKEIARLQDDRYVDWDWICDYFGVTRSTARKMLANEKAFIHGQQIKRFKKSDIIRFAERYSVKVKYVN